MTTSDTRDAQQTIEQIIRLADAGCEIARITVQGKKEAESCEAIKNGLIARGYSIPLVADIHFYPPAAMVVAPFVDKIRINPGNFVDRRATFRVIEYDDAAYSQELLKIEEGFSPLVELCKRLKKAIRIGANHGSLSDRIMNRYGDSPRGMVESALEFARICRQYDFHNFLFSMKASNPIVMIQAYRLLVAEMDRLGWDYPLHLGVTEAGEGEDGRIKSSIGIGSLLLDGLGDTIRVSLTEDPWSEIDPCRRLVRFFEEKKGKGIEPFGETHRNVEEIAARPTTQSAPLHSGGTVMVKITAADLLHPDFILQLGAKTELGQIKKGIDTPDLLWIDEVPLEAAPLARKLIEAGIGILSSKPLPGAYLLSNLPQSTPYALLTHTEKLPSFERKPDWIVFQPLTSPLHETRRFVDQLKSAESDIPVLLAFSYPCDAEDLPIHAGAELGACLADKLAEGICLLANQPIESLRRLSFNLLQGARMRTTKTDFISCPGCGRTLFDLQEVSRRIREKTAHLPGVKIAIMGCIVNGPGEMADADFGYVGSKTNHIDLYVGKSCVERNIAFADADERLINLIKVHGKWEDPIDLS